MNSLGLHTGLDMRNQTLEFMQANFGEAGAYHYWISRGVDNREVRANRIRKSVGAENTFSSDLTDFDAVAAELRPLIDKVWRHCEDKGSRGRTVTPPVLRDRHSMGLLVHFCEVCCRGKTGSNALMVRATRITQSRHRGLQLRSTRIAAAEISD
jgi:nucleotidyltransferase/DNA polymerase involved in DNA repair